MKYGLLLFMLLPLLAHGYISWRVWQLLPLPVWARVCVLALMLLTFVSLFASFAVSSRFPLGVTAAIYETGTTWIEVILYLTLTFITLDLLRLCHVIPASWLHGNWWTAGAVTALMVGLFVCGNIVYRNKLRTPITLQSTKISRPVKAVLLSDLHLGYHNRRSEFARWVDIINAEHPDLILIAGDIIDFSSRHLIEERVAEEFHRLNAPVYACLGNHEYISGDTAARRFFAEAGIHLLSDSATIVGSQMKKCWWH